MRLTEGLDSGPVCLSAQEPIAADDTYGTLAPRLAALGGRLLVEALDTSPPFAEQDEAGATYAEKIIAEDRCSPPTGPRVELERVVRALTPHIGAALTGVGRTRERLGVWEAAARPPQSGDPAPGELRLDERGGGADTRLCSGNPGADHRPARRAQGDGRRRLPARPAELTADAQRGRQRRASAPTPSCGACSSRTPTPIAPFTPRPRAGARRARPGVRHGAGLRDRPAQGHPGPRRRRVHRAPA